MRRPRCFVAIAVDRDDTDALYDRCIQPVLRRIGATAVIVSRRQSNDDLNNQIVDQLDRCDFCIADLTYARPSVYFEAGYAQRVVPVIYTVRRDHLRRHQSDDRRVHFDLQMKPLVTWASASDRRFRSQLERRLRSTVLKDWRRRRAAQAAVDRERERFAALPITARLAKLTRHVIRRCRTEKFRSWRVGDDRAGPYKDPTRFVGASNLFLGAYRGRKLAQIVTVQAHVQISSAGLERLWSLVYFARALQGPFEDDLGIRPNSVEAVSVHHIALSLRPVPPARIEAALPHVGRSACAGHYVRQDVTHIGVYGTSAPVPLRVNLHIVADLKSEKDLRRRLDMVVNDITGERQPNTAMKPSPASGESRRGLSPVR